MSIKVIREKQVTPPVKKVIVELTPEEFKYIICVLGQVPVDSSNPLATLSCNLYNKLESIVDIRDLNLDSPFKYPIELELQHSINVNIKFRDDI